MEADPAAEDHPRAQDQAQGQAEDPGGQMAAREPGEGPVGQARQHTGEHAVLTEPKGGVTVAQAPAERTAWKNPPARQGALTTPRTAAKNLTGPTGRRAAARQKATEKTASCRNCRAAFAKERGTR